MVGGVEAAGEGAEDGAGLEAAVEDVRGEDGVGVGLVFGVGGVGPEGGHLWGLRPWEMGVCVEFVTRLKDGWC